MIERPSDQEDKHVVLDVTAPVMDAIAITLNQKGLKPASADLEFKLEPGRLLVRVEVQRRSDVLIIKPGTKLPDLPPGNGRRN